MTRFLRMPRPEVAAPAFLQPAVETQWLRMTGFLLAHLNTPADLLSDAIFAAVALDDEAAPDDRIWLRGERIAAGHGYTVRLYGVTAQGTSAEDAARNWRTAAHTQVAIVSRQRKGAPA